jgi:hypothetical protein
VEKTQKEKNQMKEYETILKKAKGLNIVTVDGFNDCIIGLCDTFEGARLLYSENKIIEKLKNKMSETDALGYFELEILGKIYTPTGAPIFLDDYFSLKGK